jgi:hypothetical protein
MPAPALDTLIAHASPALQAWAEAHRQQIEDAVLEQIRFEQQVVQDNRQARQAQARDRVRDALSSDPTLQYIGLDGLLDRMYNARMIPLKASEWVGGEGDEQTNARWERFLFWWMLQLRKFQDEPQDKRVSFQSRARSEFWLMKRGALGDKKAWEDLRKAIVAYLDLWSRDWFATKAQEREWTAVLWMTRRLLGPDRGLYVKPLVPGLPDWKKHTDLLA